MHRGSVTYADVKGQPKETNCPTLIERVQPIDRGRGFGYHLGVPFGFIVPDACWTIPTVASPKESLPAPRGEQALALAIVPNGTGCAGPAFKGLFLPSQSRHAGKRSRDPISPQFAEYDIPIRPGASLEDVFPLTRRSDPHR